MAKICRVVAFGLMLFTAVSWIASRTALGEDAERAALSPAIQRVLAWLPEGTETIAAAQSFTMPSGTDDNKEPQTSVPSKRVVDALLIGVIDALFEPENAKHLKPLVGKKVILALRGSQNYECVGVNLPSYRSENCTFIVFEKDLGETGKGLLNTLRDGAQEVRTLAGRDVYEFPPTRSMRKAQATKWAGKLGVYLLLLCPDTILCATSDKYLEEVLKRIDNPPSARALPSSLREWEYVDPTAPFWILRHIPETKKGIKRAVIEGLAWTITKDRFRVVYLPMATAAGGTAERYLREFWDPDDRERDLTIERLKDGAVSISFTTDDTVSIGSAMNFIGFYCSEAEMGGRD